MVSDCCDGGGRCCSDRKPRADACTSVEAADAGATCLSPAPATRCCDRTDESNKIRRSVESKQTEAASCCFSGGCSGGGGGCSRAEGHGGSGSGRGCCDSTAGNSRPCCDSAPASPSSCCSTGVACCSEEKEEEGGASSDCCVSSADCCGSPSVPPQDSNMMTGNDNDGGSGNDPLMCLAVLRSNGSGIDVFDALGRSRSFSYAKPASSAAGGGGTSIGRANDGGGNGGNNGSASRKICYSTHGAGNGELDGLLTPCFDGDGRHGDPEEGCFCGIDTPHLHAHVHDPVRCGGHDDASKGIAGRKNNSNNNEKKSSSADDDLGFLAQLTLHPDDDGEGYDTESETAPFSEGGNNSNNNVNVVNIPISDSLPKQCNSKELTGHLRDRLGLHGPARWKRSLRRTRMYQVRHDDHTDFLVPNDATGDLHLEHPCKSCGDHDLHGKFHLVHERRWMDDGSDLPPEPNDGGKGSLRGDGVGSKKEIRLHFFEASAGEPFRLLNVLSNFFETDCGRVHAVREMDDVVDHHHHDHDHGHHAAGAYRGLGHHAAEEEKEQKLLPKPLAGMDGGVGGATAVVRSQFHVERICCSSEIPAIRSTIQPLDGVAGVSVNPTVKTVYVDHDPETTTATDIEDALNGEGFGARVKRDGGAAFAKVPAAAVAPPGEPRVGRSHFFVRKICCTSEVPAIRAIVEPLPGVMKEISVNTTTKTLYVDHDVDEISAADIAAALNGEKFGATVRRDAGQAFAIMSGIPTDAFVRSAFIVPLLKSEEDVEALYAVLAKCSGGHVRERTAHLPTSTVTIEHNPYFLSATGIVEFLRKEGLEASISTDGAADGMWALSLMNEEADDGIEHHTATVRPHVILSGLFWIISMLSYIGDNWEYLKYVGLLSVAFGLPQIALKAWRTLRRYHFDANCMMLFAAVGAVALQEYTEAAAVTFLFAISETLETRATARARNALSAIVSLRPDRANILNPITKELVVVPAASVAVGAIVSVRTGDKIPCDGVVIDGQSTVDESSLTGESRPVRKGPKDAVSGGTINSGSTQLIVKTTATADNSAVARLIRLVEEAQANRSTTEKLVDEFAKRYTPFVVLAALCMCTIPWAFGRDVGAYWTMNGLITIVIACPCALIISTPVTYVAGLAASAQKGIIVKGGAHLEALGSVKEIAFDKTGTLTEGVFALLHLNVIGGRRTRREVLEYLALVEAPAAHPLAAAIVAAAVNEGVSIPKHLNVQNHSLLPGEGVTAVVDGKEVHVGNATLFRRLGLFEDLPKQQQTLFDEWADCGGTVGFISIEGEGIVGAYCVADAIRPEAKEVVDALQGMGINITMLTGDQRPAAVGIGTQVGLHDDNIKSELLPEDKLDFISGMVEANKKKDSLLCNPCSPGRNVLMCGDGVNDAPALALADVSVAMGEGAALAMETSDVTLMDSNLNKLLFSIRMGRRVIRTIIENVAFSLVTKAIVMGFTFAGKASLWAAIGSDVGAMLLVTLNGMKLLPSKKKVKENDLIAASDRKADDTARISFLDEMMSRITLATEGNDVLVEQLNDGPDDGSLLPEKSACAENVAGCCSIGEGGNCCDAKRIHEFKNEPTCCCVDDKCCSKKINSHAIV